MIGSTRSCGMNRSCATVLTLPLPLIPAVYQSSTICRSDIGTSATTGYGSPPPPTRIAMISCQWACSAPLTNPHLPLTTMPPSVGAAIALGLSVPHTRTSGVENTSSWTESGNMQAIHPGIQYTEAVHAVAPSPRPSWVATSTRVRVSHSNPP
jgi:hypothetical protein